MYPTDEEPRYGKWSNRDDAQYALENEFGEEIPEEDVVHCEDTDDWVHSDDAYDCDGCDRHFMHRSGLNNELLCEECAEEYADQYAEERLMRSSHYASLGVITGRM